MELFSRLFKLVEIGGGFLIWLVGQGHPSEKYDFVNWDDEINPIFSWENAKFMFQPFTTNQ